jgi:transcriptional regulator of heat shock response
MPITERQKDILNSVVKEYIDSARPVSSQFLEKEYDFGVCPATIRNEMQKLTDAGFLHQPYTSAGRVPTDKGYRFFVDDLLGRYIKKDFNVNHDIKAVTKFLASESLNLALGYLAIEKILWKEGWKQVLAEPEFSQSGLAVEFARMVDDFEEHIEDFFLPEIKIYIGRENPVSRTRDFSIITLGFEDGLFALFGPKRMSYDKNIKLFFHLCQTT